MNRLYCLLGLGLSLGGCALPTLAAPSPLPNAIPLSVAHDFNLESKMVPNPHFSTMAKTSDNDHESASFPTHILTAPLVGCASLDFSAPVMLGNQGPFQLIVDTGSSTLGVAGSAASCPTCVQAGLSPLYTPTAANLASTATVAARFGDGSGWNASVYKETVKVGEASATGVVIASMLSQTNFFRQFGCDRSTVGNTHQGIIGYAYPTLALRPTTTFLSSWQQQTQSPNVFTLQMCRTTGTLWHGQVDPASYTGSLVWVPIVEQLYYVVHLNDISLQAAAGSATYISLGATPTNPPTRTIFDSGSTQIILPLTAFNALQAALNQNAQFSAAFGQNFLTGGVCLQPQNGLTMAQLNQQLPKLQVTIGDANGNNPVNLQLSAISSYVLLTKDTAGRILYCPGAGTLGAPMSPAATINILGWSVMNQYVVVHDVANSMIGLAPSKCNTIDATGTSSPPGVIVGAGVPNPNFVANPPGVTGAPTIPPPPTTPANSITVTMLLSNLPTALTGSATLSQQLMNELMATVASILGINMNTIMLVRSVTTPATSQEYIVMNIMVPMTAAANTGTLFQTSLNDQITNPMSQLSLTQSAALTTAGSTSPTFSSVVNAAFGAQAGDVAPGAAAQNTGGGGVVGNSFSFANAGPIQDYIITGIVSGIGLVVALIVIGYCAVKQREKMQQKQAPRV